MKFDLQWTRNESKVLVLFLSWIWIERLLATPTFTPRMCLESKIPRWKTEVVWWDFHGGRTSRDADSHVLKMKNNPCYYSRCKMTVFEEKCLASEPFVKEHVDVNVHLPQMFTELLLNKLFVPYLFSVMVNVFSLDYFFSIWGPETETIWPVIRPQAEFAKTRQVS